MSMNITTDLFRNPENRFAFSGGSEFAVSIADTIDQLMNDLAAARADAALLRSTLIDTAAVMGMSSLPSDSEWEKIRNKALQLVAALAGEKK